MSELGLVFLSKEIVKRAEAQFTSELPGVRDEIGFLLIHFFFADHFFPGTSVLQTRLRYISFIVLIFKELLARRDPDPRAAVARAEHRLKRRLIDPKGGVIGGRSGDRPSDQSPTSIYWGALNAWRFLQTDWSGGSVPRTALDRLIRQRRVALRDDDKQPLVDDRSPLAVRIDEPPEWDGEGTLTFDLTPQEFEILAGQLSQVPCPNAPGKISLLGRFAEATASPGDPLLFLDDGANFWDSPFKSIWGPFAEDVKIARHSAALARAGRALYAHMVEQLAENDGLTATTGYRAEAVTSLVASLEEACQTDLDALFFKAPRLPDYLLDVLVQTQEWLRRNGAGGDPMELLAVYRRAEMKRKGLRARLAQELSGRKRREEWAADATKIQQGALEYRWPIVQRLLSDLRVAG